MSHKHMSVSSIALITAIIALTWNIIRDLLLDKTSIKIHIVFGEVGNIKNSTTALFAEAGSLKPDHKFNKKGTLVKIINTGRRDVVIRGVGGELKDGTYISMVIQDLPKILKPYEEFSNISEIVNSFMDSVNSNRIKKLWAIDTKNKKWLLSNKGLRKLKETADYINSEKNL